MSYHSIRSLVRQSTRFVIGLATLFLVARPSLPAPSPQGNPNRPPSAQHSNSKRSTTPRSSSTAEKPSADEQFLMDRVNEERAKEHLPALTWDSKLAAAARLHCQLMVQHATLSHQFPGELSLQDRVSKSGARFNTLAENVATAPTTTTIHSEWMHSSGHRANILDHDVTSIGISVISNDGQLFAVEDFSEAVENLSLQQQESSVATLLSSYHLPATAGSDAARKTCAMSQGWSGDSPRSVTRFESSNLTALPSNIAAKAQSGQYRTAAVGACDPPDSSPFTHYRIAILFY